MFIICTEYTGEKEEEEEEEEVEEEEQQQQQKEGRKRPGTRCDSL